MATLNATRAIILIFIVCVIFFGFEIMSLQMEISQLREELDENSNSFYQLGAKDYPREQIRDSLSRDHKRVTDPPQPFPKDQTAPRGSQNEHEVIQGANEELKRTHATAEPAGADPAAGGAGARNGGGETVAPVNGAASARKGDGDGEGEDDSVVNKAPGGDDGATKEESAVKGGRKTDELAGLSGAEAAEILRLNEEGNAAWWRWWEDKGSKKMLGGQKYCMRWKGESCCEQITSDDLMVIHDSNGPAAADDVTLVTFGTYQRISSFRRAAKTWPGPKVLFLYFTVYNAGEEEIVNAELEEVKNLMATDAEVSANTRIVAYVARGPDECTDDVNTFHGKEKGGAPELHPLIPINTMRNIAADSARTRFIFPLDLDFFPSITLYPNLRQHLWRLGSINRAAFVVPQFAMFTCSDRAPQDDSLSELEKFNSQLIPLDFDDLAWDLLDGRVKTFHGDNTQFGLPSSMRKECDVTQHDHTPLFETDYKRYLEESLSPYGGIYEIDAFLQTHGHTLQEKDLLYEPYIVISRVDRQGREIPRYNEHFVGYYKNKISWLTELRIWKYIFYVVRREFVAHAPHAKSRKEEETPGHWRRMWELYISDIHEQYRKRGKKSASITGDTGKEFKLPATRKNKAWDNTLLMREMRDQGDISNPIYRLLTKPSTQRQKR
eukprot:Rmarinus@m.11655